MSLDYGSLLLAIGFSGVCLAITMFGSWLTMRKEGLLLKWAVSALLIVFYVFLYAAYVAAPNLLLLAIGLTALQASFAILFGAARQFRTNNFPRKTVVLSAAVAIGACLVPLAFGYDGLALIAENAAATLLLLATAREYWKGRREMPALLLALAALYAVTALSFLLCGVVLAMDGRLVLGAAPNNWAENLSLIVVTACLTGIGALSLTLNQTRLTRRHRLEAFTDSLTGLPNRRALFERFHAPIGEQTAVIVFDLDNFKSINDAHGHAAGDDVLRVFARILASDRRPLDVPARLGGEEFALVLTGIKPEKAFKIAEHIRSALAHTVIPAETSALYCTVSAGIAFGSKDGAPFDRVLNAADQELYSAKRAGRNRIATTGQRQAS
ncbi:GGDEF domain-containing protein [Oryzicola mucosus]|uniref:diguanylate cyclase n=1 Tax=Oryzicola mucosus TaxID=2767425 RepID=A0A8J6PWM9_9HYPH|nr:GGDEF domain-containing protein [Oryzicola mucosus]MBD0416251.1 GGDEF domain-containing protein [Oryzicola mucosus]